MTHPAWQIAGRYYETCSCDFVCPCLPAQMTAQPTKGSCTFAMAFQIENGSYGNLGVGGLGFVVLGFTPEAMGKGNWSVGVLVDDRASAEQRDAIVAMASGAAGGPMSALGGLVGTFLGAEAAPIRFAARGAGWSVSAGEFLEMSAQPAMGINPDATEPLFLENTGHPAADRFALARATGSRVRALGLEWSDSGGRNNGQYAPFSWRSAQ